MDNPIASVLRTLFNPLTSKNRRRMADWAAFANRMAIKSPGSDEGFSQEDIDREAKADLSKMSTWTIICEEVLDTQFPRVYFERAREELQRRGISDSEIREMRRFAWMTAGWMNFEMMVWEWGNMDERDIYQAIQWQYADGWISARERDRRIEYAQKYDKATAPCARI